MFSILNKQFLTFPLLVGPICHLVHVWNEILNTCERFNSFIIDFFSSIVFLLVFVLFIKLNHIFFKGWVALLIRLYIAEANEKEEHLDEFHDLIFKKYKFIWEKLRQYYQEGLGNFEDNFFFRSKSTNFGTLFLFLS